MIIPSPEVPLKDFPVGGSGPPNWLERLAASPGDPGPQAELSLGPGAESGRRSINPVNCEATWDPPFATPVAVIPVACRTQRVMHATVFDLVETIAVRCHVPGQWLQGAAGAKTASLSLVPEPKLP